MCAEREGEVRGRIFFFWKVKKFVTSARKRGMCKCTVRLGGKQRGEKKRKREENGGA